LEGNLGDAKIFVKHHLPGQLEADFVNKHGVGTSLLPQVALQSARADTQYFCSQIDRE